MERSLRIAGHLFFLLLLLFAVVFANERVLFSDSAYYLFKIINYEQFNIEYARFPAVLTQLFTLAGVKLHLPLRWLIVSYSVSFILVYYAVFLLSVYTFRNVVAGLTIVFVLCVGVRHSFFHIVTETHQALVYACLFYAWMMHQNAVHFTGSWKWLLNLLAGVVIICFAGYSHPVAYLVMLFCILYFMVEKDKFKSAPAYLMLGLVVVLAIVKYVTTPSGNYEGQFLSQLTMLDEIMQRFPRLDSIRFFVRYFVELYSYVFVLLAVVSVHYVATSQMKKLVLVLGYFLGFLAFAFIIFNMGDSRVMMERAFMPLTVLAGIPFLNDFVRKGDRLQKAKLSAVILLVVVSFAGIYGTSRYFSKRIEYMDEILAYMKTRSSHKLLVDWNNTTNELIYIPWAFATETLLYSTEQDATNARTVFVFDDLSKLDAPLQNEDLFLCVPFDMQWEDSKLNKKYFNLPRELYFVQQTPLLKQEGY